VIELREAVQRADYESPFDLSVPGFEERWWDHAKRIRFDAEDTFSFFDGAEEVARAEVVHDWDFDRISYELIDLDPHAPNISFFEVRRDCYRQGVGRAALKLLASHYGNRDIIAYSEDADEFWAGIGWRRVRRLDGDEAFRPLFAHLS
jgi:hypothetical protein